MLKKVLELLRVSTEGQADADRASIPAQHTVNRRTCQQYGLEIVRSIEITDVSGASVLRSPEMQELLKLIEAPDIQGVVAREFSRLMRPENFADYALLQAFADSCTVLYLPEGPLDFTNKSGRLMGTIRAAIAGMERTEILERIWSAKEEKRRRGELGQSPVVLPWGVGYANGKFFYKPESECVREAFRQFLGGNQSYQQLSKLLNVTPRGMHVIMRNPIWTGWRVIDQKRDTSAAGRYSKADGRQSDRRKISRAPEDVIRIQVIDKPLISQAEFDAVQRIMDQKQKRHWRTRPDYQHRFTYRGFLSCADCGNVIHTAFARCDYYTCKGRRVLGACKTSYMGRERLEGALDALLAQHLTSRSFLQECVDAMQAAGQCDTKAASIQRLRAQLSKLKEKRERVIELFLEGVIGREERNQRLLNLDREITTFQELLMRESPAAVPQVTSLVDALAPLAEWVYWNPDQKRSVLSAIMPDIRVADYKIASVGLNPTIFSNEVNHSGKGSSPPPA